MSIRDKLQVMVVDDTATSRGLIIQALETMGIVNIHHAADAAAALVLLRQKPVHLVLSDFNMPGMDGLGLLRELRADPRTQQAGFILVTGRPDEEMIRTGRQLGMNNLIRKPFTPAELKACLEAVVGRI